MNMKKPLIIVGGANPAWQKTLFFREFIPGKVNRAYREENYPSGKGVNFCRAARCADTANTCLLQFAGGDNGNKLCSALEQDGFSHETINTAAETRNCITCLDDNGNMTELIGVSYQVLPEEGDNYIDKLSVLLKNADLFAVTGTLPDGSDPAIYIRSVKLAITQNIPVLLDTMTAVNAMLEVPGRMILKVNQEEFLKITGEDEIMTAHRKAQQIYPGKVFAVTNGGDSATLSDNNTLWKYTLPYINVVNPLGSGDTASAVMSGCCAAGESSAEAFRKALAAASANCLTPMAGEFSTGTAAGIAGKITIEQQELS